MATPFKSCSVTGCKENAHHSLKGARGFCHKHYRRWRRHGDPLGGGTERGAPDKYLTDVVLGWSSDECLLWPFSRTSAGYGQIRRDGRPALVHRIACSEVHGRPASTDLDAAHSCGNGHLGCVSPRHLRWATTAENMADRIAHGTANRGERQGSSKLTAAEVVQIRRLAGSVSGTKLAAQFGVSCPTISGIVKGTRWAWLKDQDD